MEFKDLGLSTPVLEAISQLGFVEPTEIQQKAIPVLKDSKSDFVGLAQTGTGKTAAFGLPLLERIDATSKKTQGLVICPTRELCLQITAELKKYAKNMRGVNIVPVYGGADIRGQMRAIDRGAQIIVATPGRMIDHIQRKTANLSTVSVVILDEADEMLKMGFQDDINKILEFVPKTRSTWLFSATMPPEVARIAKNYMTDPTRVTVGSKNSSAKNISHQYCVVRERDKYKALRVFVDANPNMFSIIFCRTRRDTKDVARMLMRDGYSADALHGDMSQSQRDAVMGKFRDRRLDILVATDVAARGIDVNDVTHVFHYHLPDDAENYTHRSGRTGRAGKSGHSIAIANAKEARRIRYIERFIGKAFEPIKVPTAQVVREQRLNDFVDRMQQAPQAGAHLDEALTHVLTKLETVSKEDMIKRLLSAECATLLKRYQNDISFDVDSSDRRSSDRGGSRLFINLGSMDGLDSDSFAELIAQEGKIEASDVSRVELKETFSFCSLSSDEMAQKVMQLLNDVRFNGRKVRVELAGQRSGGRRNGGGGGRRFGGGGSRGGRFGGRGGERRGGRPSGGRRSRF